jgi:hypothetical protein
MGYVDGNWINLVLVRVQWWFAVKTVMNFRFSSNTMNVLS